MKAVSGPAAGDLEVWLRWTSDAATLRRFVWPHAALENCLFAGAEQDRADPTLWRCLFVHIGTPAAIDDQRQMLLRRLTAIAPWLKAVRHAPAPLRDAASSHRAVPEELDDGPYDWDRFSRRALP